MKLNKLLMGVAAAGLLSLPGTASAIVTSWDYMVGAQWQNWTPIGPVTHETVDNDDVLRWGTPTTGSQSSLHVTRRIDSSASNTDKYIPIITGSATGSPGATITHNNFPILGPSLDATQLRIEATFTPLTVSRGETLPPGTGDITRVFNIDFTETTNVAPCDPRSVSVCDDMFDLRNPEQLARRFTVGGQDYLARLNFGAFAGGRIFFEDINGDGIRDLFFLTQENRVATLETFITITAVPEPGALALIGAGLAGVGFTARRRRKA